MREAWPYRSSAVVVLVFCLGGASLVVPGRSAGASDQDQLEEAVMPLPEAARSGATVLGYRDGSLVTLREAGGAFVCIADDPDREGFHVACYHRSLEPYMARGRELRAEGVSGQESIVQRWREIEAGELAFPDHPAALHQLFAQRRDAAENLDRLTVIYVSGATAEQTGLPTRPEGGAPWLMFPGEPTAHVMISG